MVGSVAPPCFYVQSRNNHIYHMKRRANNTGFFKPWLLKLIYCVVFSCCWSGSTVVWSVVAVYNIDFMEMFKNCLTLKISLQMKKKENWGMCVRKWKLQSREEMNKMRDQNQKRETVHWPEEMLKLNQFQIQLPLIDMS